MTSSSTTTPQPDDATRVWEQLSQRVDSLIATWEAGGDPPQLGDYLPASPQHVRHMALVELIKVDLEYRWQQRGLPKLLEAYATEFPELADAGGIPCDLIYEEYQIRRQTPNPPQPSEYYTRFPEQSAPLRRLLTLAQDQKTATLTLVQRTPEIEVGQQLDDFDLLTRFGKGAFATVFLARQRSMQRLVALKVSRDKGSEPQTLALLDHPHIVRVYDQRTLEDRQLRLMYMQHIPGGTLQAVVRRVRETPPAERTGKLLLDAIDQTLIRAGDSPPTDSGLRRRLAAQGWPEVVCWLGARLAEALDYAYLRGVLHRDVKPANVLLAADGSPKLADFNVSFSSKLEGSTPAAYFGGSLAYMSPEQLEASDVDHERRPDQLDGRSDIYSLAVMLWELLAGERPFPDEAEATWGATLKTLIATRKAGLPAEAIASLPANRPGCLDEVLMECLSPKADDRPATAAQLARQLDWCMRPALQALLRPARGSLGQRFRQHPLVWMIATGLPASAALSPFNIMYNWTAIVQFFKKDIRHVFVSKQLFWINLVAYSTGIGIAVWQSWAVINAVGKVDRGHPPDPARITGLRRQSVKLGDYIGWITLALWAISGIIFPAWLHAEAEQTTEFGGGQFAHFFASQVLCGLIAAAQAFFLVTYVEVRGFFPALLSAHADADSDEAAALHRLSRRATIAFYLTVTTPFIGVALACIPDILELRIGIAWLAAIGMVGSVIAFFLLRAINRHIAVLTAALDPQQTVSTAGTAETDSFWTASR